MRYYSTRSASPNGYRDAVDFAQAALKGLAPDGGLFVPETIPAYASAVRNSLGSMSFQETAFETIKPFVEGTIPVSALEELVSKAFTFDAPLATVGAWSVLELFHGPTAAFKDFGARFMARAFSYFRRGEDKPLYILTATSGDTGGAVADGFFGVEGIFVTIAYPKGRVSPLQEKQIAGLGGNIQALAVDGSFDDCQRLVKSAFAAEALQGRSLSSANSINIARLLPQMVYYSAGAGRLHAKTDERAVVSVPSGNFGNLTAGMYAREMGAPIERFVAATNENKTVPDYLESGVYTPRASKPTLSNAMDVGAPSNFERIASQWRLEELRELLSGVFVSDERTRETIYKVYRRARYFLDPHTAVGWAGLEQLNIGEKNPCIVLSTAHPAKFAETVEPLTEVIPVPSTLQTAMERTVSATTIPADIDAFVEALLAR